VIGGKNEEDNVLKECEKFDIKSNKWTKIASLQTPSHSVGITLY
jgi:hypothetical protein